MNANLVNLITKSALKNVTPSEKSLLQVYASFGDPDGTNCYPSIKNVVVLSLFSRRKVLYLLKSLKKKGFLIATGWGLRGTVSYKINLEMLSTQSMGGASCAPHSQNVVKTPLTRKSAENNDLRPLQPMGGASCAPNLNTSIINNNIYTTAYAREGAAEDGVVHEKPTLQEFEEFWNNCPRRIFKSETYKNYFEARKLISHCALVEKIKAYSRQVYSRQIPEKYVKSSYLWLQDMRWLDDYGSHELPQSTLNLPEFKPFSITCSASPEKDHPLTQEQKDWVSELIGSMYKSDQVYHEIKSRMPFQAA